jgi:hypothetical protein
MILRSRPESSYRTDGPRPLGFLHVVVSCEASNVRSELRAHARRRQPWAMGKALIPVDPCLNSG